MLMTEEQARTKWCPMARRTAEGHGSWNRNRNGSASDSCLCITSGCMAWHSAGQQRETARNYHDAPTIKRIDGRAAFHTYEGGWQYSHTDTDRAGCKFDLLHRIPSDDAPMLGYCGAFGKPEV